MRSIYLEIFRSLSLYVYARISMAAMHWFIAESASDCISSERVLMSCQRINLDTFYSRISDTENIRFVFAAVKDTILQLNLKEYNLV